MRAYRDFCRGGMRVSGEGERPHTPRPLALKGLRAALILEAEEICEELRAGGGEHGFGVELDAFDREIAVAEAHDHAVFRHGGDGQAARESAAFDHQRMIARGGERAGQAAKQGFAVVADLAGFSVHEARGADHAPAKRLADALMTEADAEDGYLRGEAADQLHADARLARRAGAGGDHDALGAERRDFVERDAVVAAHQEFLPELAEDLSQVVGEGIVVVDEQDHCSKRLPRCLRRLPRRGVPCACSRAERSARALLTDSSYSRWGTESATMPAPACTQAIPPFATSVRMAMQESILPE